MSAELNFKDPGDIEATISFTLTVRQWIEVQKALISFPHYGPTGVIKEAVNDLTRKACGTLRFIPVEQGAE